MGKEQAQEILIQCGFSENEVESWNEKEIEEVVDELLYNDPTFTLI
jgi:hypothetical protein